MTMTKSLKATKRDGFGKGMARKLRQEGRVPAVVYGKEMEPVHVSVDAKEALHLFQSISVDNTIVELEVEGDSAHQTLVREIQTHAYRNDLVHIDFLRIQAGVMVDVEIPIHLEGTPVGVKESGGVLDHTLNELPVRCIPSNIPDEIVVDVSGLDLNDVLHVSDVVLPEGVEVTIDPSRTICSVAVPRTPTLDEEDEAAAAAEEPELVGEADDEESAKDED